MFRIICSNLLQRKKHYAAVFLELVIVMIVGYLVMIDLIDWFNSEAAYKKLGLDHVVYYTMQGEDIQAEEYAALTDADYIGRSFTGKWADDVSWTPVTEAYISCIPYTYMQKMDWENIEGLKAIIPKNLFRDYKFGENYTLLLDEEELHFTVVGIVEDQWMFLPPVTGSGDKAVGKNAVLLFDDQVVGDVFQETNTCMLWFDDPEQKASVMDLFGDSPDIMEIADLNEKNDSLNQLELEVMGEPILILIFISLLCCTATVSHVLLSVIAFQRKYGICYICGSTWRKCVRIQVITDSLPVVLAILVSSAGIVLCAKCFSLMSWNGTAIAAGALLVMVIFVLSEFLGGVSMRKRNLTEIVEEIYG